MLQVLFQFAAVYSTSKRIDLLTYLTYLQILSGVTGIWEPPGMSSSVVPPTEVCHEITWKEKSPHEIFFNFSATLRGAVLRELTYSSWAWILWKVYERLTSPTNILSAPVMQTCVVSLLFQKWRNSCKGHHYRRARGAFWILASLAFEKNALFGVDR